MILPPDGKKVLLEIACPDSGIDSWWITAWHRDPDTWWTGLPGQYERVPEGWVATRWVELPEPQEAPK